MHHGRRRAVSLGGLVGGQTEPNGAGRLQWPQTDQLGESYGQTVDAFAWCAPDQSRTAWDICNGPATAGLLWASDHTPGQLRRVAFPTLPGV